MNTMLFLEYVRKSYCSEYTCNGLGISKCGSSISVKTLDQMHLSQKDKIGTIKTIGAQNIMKTPLYYENKHLFP